MNITGPISLAGAHTSRILFRSFDLGTWFVFGLIFFLDQLLDGGGGSSARLPGNFGGVFSPRGVKPSAKGTVTPDPFVSMAKDAHHWIADHAAEVWIYGSIAVVVAFVFGLVLLWLSCRGQMMAVHAVARAEGRMSDAWQSTRDAGWALFRFRLVFGLITLTLWVPLLISAGVLLFEMIERKPSPGFNDVVVAMIPLIVLGVLLAIVTLLIECFLRGFVVPMMLLFRINSGPAWGRFFAIAKDEPLQMIGYVVMRIGISLAIGIVSFIVVLVTCCLGGLPVIRTTLLAPLLVFERAYSLFVLASIGPEYQMITPDIPPPTWGSPYGGYMPPGGYGPPPA